MTGDRKYILLAEQSILFIEVTRCALVIWVIFISSTLLGTLRSVWFHSSLLVDKHLPQSWASTSTILLVIVLVLSGSELVLALERVRTCRALTCRQSSAMSLCWQFDRARCRFSRTGYSSLEYMMQANTDWTVVTPTSRKSSSLPSECPFEQPDLLLQRAEQPVWKVQRRYFKVIFISNWLLWSARVQAVLHKLRSLRSRKVLSDDWVCWMKTKHQWIERT